MFSRRILLTSALIARPMFASRQAAAADAAQLFRQSMALLERRHGGRLGVAVSDATGKTYGHREGERFPLCSTHKLLAAAFVLARVGMIAAAGGRAAVIPTDVSDAEASAALVRGTLERFGRLDAAFNNAGVMGAFKPIAEATVEDFDRTIATNLRGVWLMVKNEVEAMLPQGGGSIVNTSSFLALGAAAGSSAYSASKGGLDAMVRAVALEVGPHGIRINNVNPGAIRTPMSMATPEPVMASLAAHAALKRVGEPEDVADLAVWLCTDGARFITGQSILVDGGFNIAGMR